MTKANFGWWYPAGAEHDPSAPYNQIDAEPCTECDGDGYVVTSCCVDDIKGNDIDLCPTCGEHCGMEQETCEHCNGTGEEPVETYEPDPDDYYDDCREDDRTNRP